MRFANESYWLLLAVPAVAMLCWWRLAKRRERLEEFAETALLPALIPEHQKQNSRLVGLAVMTGLAVFFISLSLLRPLWGFTWKESKRKGVDIVVAIDMSESMLAEDVSPNRLERARRELIDLTEHLRGDRVALVAFAGTAFIETPLTLDYGTFRLFLESLSPELIPVKGTNIEAALSKSISAFTLESENDEILSATRARAIILITDGEHLEGRLERIRELVEKNRIGIYIIGIGTPQGGPIPLSDGYKKDKEGNVIITRLNVPLLTELAEKTGGIFVQSISSDQDTLAVYDQGIKRSLEDTTFEGGRAKRWNEYFQVPLFLGILLLLLESTLTLLFNLKKTPATGLEPIRLKKSVAASLVLVFGLHFYPLEALADSSESLGYQAKEDFQQGNFEQAFKNFQQAREGTSDDYRFSIGEGASLYRLNRFEEAQAAFFDAASKDQDERTKAQALYNAGNSLVQLNQLEDAIKTYEESLKLEPKDIETKENLAYAKQLLEQQQKKENEKENEEKKKQQQQQQQGQEQKQQQQQEEKEEEKKEQNQGGKGEPKDQEQKEEQQQDGKKEKKEQQQQQNKKDAEEQQNSSAQSQHEQEQQQQSQQDRSEGSEKEQEQPQDGTSEQTEPVSGKYDNVGASLLDNIEEDRSGLMDFRRKKALGELRSSGRELPEKDW